MGTAGRSRPQAPSSVYSASHYRPLPGCPPVCSSDRCHCQGTWPGPSCKDLLSPWTESRLSLKLTAACTGEHALSCQHRHCGLPGGQPGDSRGDSPGTAGGQPGTAMDSPRDSPGDSWGIAGDSPGTAGDSPGTARDSHGQPGDSLRTARDSLGTAGDSWGTGWGQPGDSPGTAMDSPGTAENRRAAPLQRRAEAGSPGAACQGPLRRGRGPALCAVCASHLLS